MESYETKMVHRVSGFKLALPIFAVLLLILFRLANACGRATAGNDSGKSCRYNSDCPSGQYCDGAKTISPNVKVRGHCASCQAGYTWGSSIIRLDSYALLAAFISFLELYRI